MRSSDRGRRLFAGQVRHPDELLPPRQLVIANGWIEGTTVASIILGVVLGGLLISGPVSGWLLAIDIPRIDTGIDTPPEAAIAVIMGCYAIAALINWYIPDTGVERRAPSKNPFYLIREFSHCVALLWRDKLAISRDDHVVLGRGRDAAIHRHRLGGHSSLLQPLARDVSAGRGRRGHRAGRALAARLVALRNAVKVCRWGWSWAWS